MGTATRVRVIFEYRNGDDNFLALHRGEFVASDGEHDQGATDAAYLSAVQQKEQHRVTLEDKRPAGHD